MDPAVCYGKGRIQGTRVMVSVILDNLAAGSSPGDIQRDYPSGLENAIAAALAYAAELSPERRLTVPA